jgi:hypothetical protein
LLCTGRVHRQLPKSLHRPLLALSKHQKFANFPKYLENPKHLVFNGKSLRIANIVLFSWGCGGKVSKFHFVGLSSVGGEGGESF